MLPVRSPRPRNPVLVVKDDADTREPVILGSTPRATKRSAPRPARRRSRCSARDRLPSNHGGRPRIESVTMDGHSSVFAAAVAPLDKPSRTQLGFIGSVKLLSPVCDDAGKCL